MRRLGEFESDEDPFDELVDEDRVRWVGYHKQRFPIADNESAVATMFLDFIPGHRGHEGQLVFNPAESTFYVVAPSVRRLIADCVAIMEDGRARIASRPEYGGALRWMTAEGKFLDFYEYRRLVDARART